MTTLAEIRQRFPQYSDLSDEALVDGLHRKFYADMPRQEFDKRVGYLPPAERAANDGMDRIIAGLPGSEGLRQQIAERDQKQDAQREAERKRFLESRGPGTRAAGTAAFFADMPFRMATQGQYGLGDALSFAGAESAASGVKEAQAKFAQANPDLTWTLGAMGEVAPGIPALASMGYAPRGLAATQAGRQRQATNALMRREAAEDLGAFERQGVTPYAPSFMPAPLQSAAKGLESSFVGRPLANAADDTLMSVARRSEEIASRYGAARGSEEGGRGVRAGLERYRDARGEVPHGASGTPAQVRSNVISAPTRESSMKTKQDALYERAWSMLPASMRDGRSKAPSARKDGPQAPRLMIRFDSTREFLENIQARNNRMIVGRDAQAPLIETGGFTSQVLQSLMNSRFNASLQTARNIRSNIRRMLSSLPANERNALTRGDMRQIESRLTQDIIQSLQSMRQRAQDGGNGTLARNIDRSIHAFRRADQYTRASFGRLERVEKLFNSKDDASLYRGVVNAARNGDLNKLRSMRMILRRDELDELSGALIRQLGNPNASAKGLAQDVDFSVATFATNWNKLGRDHPRARDLLFTNREHRQALDDLARIAQRVADVEAMRNTSNTAITGVNVGTIASTGAAYMAGVEPLMGLLGSLGAGYGASMILSRPQWARWAVRYARLRERAGQNAQQTRELRAHIGQLGGLAAGDQAAGEVYQQVLRDNGMTQ